MMRTGDRWLMTNVADEDDGDDDNYDDNGDDDVINVLMAMMVRRACFAAVILICIVTHVAAMKSTTDGHSTGVVMTPAWSWLSYNLLHKLSNRS